MTARVRFFRTVGCCTAVKAVTGACTVYRVTRVTQCRAYAVQLIQTAEMVGSDDPAFMGQVEMLAMMPQEILQQVISSVIGA